MLPLAKKVYTVTPNHIRALDGRILCEKAKSIHNDVHYMADIKSALHQALIEADQQTMIVAFGSLSYLGEIKKQYGKKKQNDR
jgi:Folylpolyglutamate synthase